MDPEPPAPERPDVLVVKPPRIKNLLSTLGGLVLVAVTLAAIACLAYRLALSAAVFNALGGFFILMGARKQARKQYEDYRAQQQGQLRRDVITDDTQGFVYGPLPYSRASWPPDFTTAYGWSDIFTGGAMVLIGSVILAVLTVFPHLVRIG